MGKKKRRLFLFDNLKFFLIALVVIGHFVDIGTSISPTCKSIFIFIYSFHMPLFLYLSGLFHKNSKIPQKVVTFIVLGYLSKIVIYLTKLILFRQNDFHFFSDGSLPWYMFVLAMFIGISYLLRDIDKRLILAISVVLACIVGYFDAIGDFLYLSRFFVFYPFYVMGQMTPKIVLGNLNKMKTVKIISACILIVWFILCFTQIDSIYALRLLFTGRNPYSATEGLGIFHRLLCYLITTVVSLCVICIVPRKKLPYVSDFGKNTLQVYFWHTTFLLLFTKVGLSALLVDSAFGRFLLIVLGSLLAVALSTKAFSFPTKQASELCKKLFELKTE